jgi:hypothetical protein
MCTRVADLDVNYRPGYLRGQLLVLKRVGVIALRLSFYALKPFEFPRTLQAVEKVVIELVDAPKQVSNRPKHHKNRGLSP